MFEDGPGQMGRRNPQPLRTGEALEQGETTIAVEAQVAGEVFGHRARGVARGLPGLDEPQSAGELGREVHADRAAILQRRRDRCRDGRRRVHHERVTGTQVGGEVWERAVDDAVLALGDEQPHVVPAATPHFRGSARFEVGVEWRRQR